MLNDLTLEEILDKYSFPQRLLAYFASQCAKDALSKIKKPDPRSIAAVDMAEAYGNGEDFTEAHKREIIDDADAATHSRGNADYYNAFASARAAASAASQAASVTLSYDYDHASDSADAAASYAAYAAYSPAAPGDYYKPLLLSLIDTRLTKLERVFIF